MDFLGDIGGFKEALFLILFFMGEYFSAKLFISKVAEDLYVTRKRRNGEEYDDRVDNEGGEEGDSMEIKDLVVQDSKIYEEE